LFVKEIRKTSPVKAAGCPISRAHFAREVGKPNPPPAAKRRKNAAHGASRG
jgi:hypothetical protein